MSGEDRREGAPQGPPWSLDVLADFHAGALDEATEEELRPRLAADPGAREVLDALEETRAELGAAPTMTVPDDVAVRVETALADEAQAWEWDAPDTAGTVAAEPGRARVIDLEEARQHGGKRGGGKRGSGRTARRVGWGVAAVASAAAVLGAFVLTTPLSETTGGKPQAIEPKAPGSAPSGRPPLALRGDEATLSGEQLTSVLGAEDYVSTLSDPARLIACLQANGVDSGKPMGAREITLNGRPAQLLILPTGQIGRFRLLTVGPRCGPGNPATISDTVVGG